MQTRQDDNGRSADRKRKIKHALRLQYPDFRANRDLLDVYIDVDEQAHDHVPTRDETRKAIADVLDGRRGWPPFYNEEGEITEWPKDIKEDMLSYRRHELNLETFSDFELQRHLVDLDKYAQMHFTMMRSEDYAYWRSLDSWSAEEAAALSLGYDPTEVNLSHLAEDFAGSSLEADFLKRMNEIERALAAKGLDDPITPSKFAEWADARAIYLANDLRPSKKVAKPKPDTPVGPERAALYRIIFALAFDDAEVDEAKIKEVAKQTAARGQLFGSPLERSTLVRHLRASVKEQKRSSEKTLQREAGK